MLTHTAEKVDTFPEEVDNIGWQPMRVCYHHTSHPQSRSWPQSGSAACCVGYVGISLAFSYLYFQLRYLALADLERGEGRERAHTQRG